MGITDCAAGVDRLPTGSHVVYRTTAAAIAVMGAGSRGSRPGDPAGESGWRAGALNAQKPIGAAQAGAVVNPELAGAGAVGGAAVLGLGGGFASGVIDELWRAGIEGAGECLREARALRW